MICGADVKGGRERVSVAITECGSVYIWMTGFMVTGDRVCVYIFSTGDWKCASKV